MTYRLFRQEALDFNRHKLLGDVMVVQPLSCRVLTAAAVSIAAAVILFAFWGEYTRKSHVSGYLAPSQGLIKVHAREAGTIVEKHVAEGQQVRKGDVLFVVSTERRSREDLESQATAIAKLRERRASMQDELLQRDRISEIERRSLQQRIHTTESELEQLSEELATQRQRVAGAATMHQRYVSLRAQAFVSEEQVQERRITLLDQQAKQQSLQRSRIGLTRELDALRAQAAAAELKARTERGATERNISSLEQELAEYESRREFVVTAPCDGTATALLADRGQTANPSTPLLSLLPAGAVLEAHLLVPSRSIGFLAPKQVVAVRYQAFPYQRFGSYNGHIAEISKSLILPNETSLPIQLQEPAYRVTVALDAQTVPAYRDRIPLQAGMVLDADIWLDRRKLYEWAFDPLYSVMGRL